MKTSKKLLSILLVIVMAFSCIIPAYAEKDTYEFDDLLEGTLPAVTTEQFVSICRVLRTMRTIFTGKFLFGDDGVFEDEWSEELIEVSEEISENSCLDPYLLLTNLPDLCSNVNIFNKVFQIDTKAYRDEMYEKAYENRDDKTKTNLYYFIGAYFSGIQSAYITLEETSDGEGDVYVYVTYTDGEVEKFHPGLYIDPETGLCHGNKQAGMMNIGFDFNYEKTLVLAPIYCWMRNFGFCIEYDFLCYILPVYRYNTRRFKFEYNDMEWMVQMWKGNYLIANGGEVGFYNREMGSFGSYYDVIGDELMVPMTLKISHGEDVLVDVKEDAHWWVNGFKLANNNLYSPKSLTLESTLTVYDEEFLKALSEAIDNNIHHDVKYAADYENLTISIVW